MYNKVELCGVNTAELPVLSEQEKRQLLTRARAGDQSARQSMIEGNLRLVLSVVQRFAQRGENLDDLFQVGCIGLIKAIDNFDPAQEVRFSTYGVPMIIGEIRRFLRDNNALRVSRSLRDTAYRAMQSREQLEKKLGREPTVEEIARQAGMSRQEVAAALESVVEPISLEEPVYTDGGDAMYVIDQVRDPDGEDSWISGLQFRQTVAGLTPREKKIMELRYLKGKTQMEVAKEIGTGQPAGKGRAGAVPNRGKITKPACRARKGRTARRFTVIFSGRVLIFTAGSRSAPQMAFCFVAGQHSLHLSEQPWTDRPQAGGDVFVDGGFAASKGLRGAPHRGVVRDDVFAQLDCPLFRISFHGQRLPP